MSWESLDTYQKLVEMQPVLNEQDHREAFSRFLDRMWTKPATYREFTRAYMEFTTPHTLTFPKLSARAAAKTNNSKSKRSRRSRRSRRRSSRRNRK